MKEKRKSETHPHLWREKHMTSNIDIKEEREKTRTPTMQKNRYESEHRYERKEEDQQPSLPMEKKTHMNSNIDIKTRKTTLVLTYGATVKPSFVDCIIPE